MNYNCQIFTPAYIAEEMVNLINYKENILRKYVLDNSCGDGNLLEIVERRYIEQALKYNKSKKEISKELSIYICGVEIDAKCVDECKKRLTNVAKEYGINNSNWNIQCADGLKYVFDVKFDYIVGNPPYIAYAMLSDEQRKYVKYNFWSCARGKFDYSYAFVEKCLSLLNKNGKMVFLTPSNMYKTEFGKDLRKIMLPYITQIVDYSFEKIFKKKVLTSPAITVFDKNAKEYFIYKLKLKSKETEKLINKNELKDKWYFFRNESKGKKRFGDYFKVSNSIATLCNKIYVINQSIMDKYTIEKEAVKKAFSPKSIKYNKNEYIIFPYFYKNQSIYKYSESEYKKLFPNTYQYLLLHKDELKNTNKDKSARWFEYGRSQALAHLNRPKLLISTITTNEINVYNLDVKDIPYSGLYIFPIKELTLEDAKYILEKKSTMNYLRTSGIILSGNSFRISTKDIENLKF